MGYGNRKDFQQDDKRTAKRKKTFIDWENIDKKAIDKYEQSDIGNARHFAEQYRNDLRYCSTWKKWLVWDGKRWAVDDKGSVVLRAIELVRNVMPKAAGTIDSDNDRTKYLRHVANSQSKNRIDNMIALAQSFMATTANELDADNMLLNCDNGTIDLRTGEFRNHKRSDMMTKLASVNYDANADCPKWREHIKVITEGNEELANYLQRAIGYSMTGDISEQCFFLLYGQGCNGKTTTVETVLGILGDYGWNGADSLLLDSRSKGVNRSDEADLRGRRMVSVSEPNAGDKFNEKQVKKLTNPTINAMRKFCEAETFVATHKLWLDTNHKPKTNATDLGFWRRVKMIPFTATIPSDKRIKDVEKVFINEEGSGILNWMLQGLADWREQGLTDEPKAMTTAVNDYRFESDTLGIYLAERTVENSTEQVKRCDLYYDYKQWSEGNGLDYPLTNINLGKELRNRGYVNGGNGNMYWLGLELARNNDNINDSDNINDKGWLDNIGD